jgi:excinuclease ABC subunit C
MTAPHETPAPQTRLEDLPTSPGCYIFRDAEGAALYVGKAKDLRARVRSYYRGADSRPLIPFLAKRSARVETLVTKTESEAILLEDTLVKKLKPTYNLRLKDDKAFYLLRLDTSQQYPRIEWVRRRYADRAMYFGPYASTWALRRTVRFLHSILPMRDCSDSILRNRTRPCLKHSIGRCSAPCVQLISEADYRELVDRAVDLLEGRTSAVIPILEARMRDAAANLEYEKAAKLRDHLEALRTTTEAQGVRLGKSLDRDVLGLHRDGERVAIQWLPFRDGKLEGGKSHNFNSELPDAEILGSFLTQFYRGDTFVPREVYVSIEPHDRDAIAHWLSEKRAGPVTLAVPRGGDAKRAVELAKANAKIVLEARDGIVASANEAAEQLREKLHLQRAPGVIDCFDISTLQGRATVASRVRFVGGFPAKDGYRRFKITSFTGQNDFAAMAEVVGRALRRDVEDQTLPDLIVIDGAKGQLSAAVRARDDAGAFEVEIVGLAKDRSIAGDAGTQHSGERVFTPGGDAPIHLPPRSSECHLLTRVRDEAHRFAIQYHRKVRGKITGVLDEIAGLGPKRRRELLRTFGSVSALAGVSADELRAKIPGFPAALAERVVAGLREVKNNAAPET